MLIRTFFTNWRAPSDIIDPVPKLGGIYGHGLFLEGAGFEEGFGDVEGCLCDAKIGVMKFDMPVTNFYAAMVTDIPANDGDMFYKCPIFITSDRGATFVCAVNVKMEEEEEPSQAPWIKAGVALLMTPE